MTYLLLYLAGVLTGLLPGSLIIVLLVTHKPRHAVPTLHHRRKNWDASESGQIMTGEQSAYARKLESGHQPIPELNGIDYRWLGMTGSEQE